MKKNMCKTHLKFILSLLLLSCISYSCSKSPKSEIQEAIEKVILLQLDDPSSYEFASLQILDTVSYIDNINHDKNLIKETIANNNSRIKRTRKIHSNESEERLNFFLSNEIEAVKIYSKALVVLDSIEKNIASQINQTSAYICCYKYRTNNELGNLTLNTLYIEISPSQEYKVIGIQNKIENLSSTPGNYPNKKLVEVEIEKYESPQDYMNKLKNAYN